MNWTSAMERNKREIMRLITAIELNLLTPTDAARISAKLFRRLTVINRARRLNPNHQPQLP